MPDLTPEQHETRQNTIFDLVENLGQLDMLYAPFRPEIAANSEKAAVTYKQLHDLELDIFAVDVVSRVATQTPCRD